MSRDSNPTNLVSGGHHIPDHGASLRANKPSPQTCREIWLHLG